MKRTIWVKEFGSLTVEKIRQYFFGDIDTKKFISTDVIGDNDLIIFSKDDNCSTDSFLPYNAYSFESLFGQIFDGIIKDFTLKKDYYYLKYALKDLSNPDVDTVISGLSYGLYGIDQRLLNNAVNLSMHSQDLYYSIGGIISGFEKNRNIKKVVLIVGYYFFFSDLSLTRNMSELSRLTYTYMPLFNDTHNSLVIPSPNTYKMSSNIIDIDGVEELLAQTQYEKGYFNPDSPRFRGDIDWKTASMEEKESKKKNGSA